MAEEPFDAAQLPQHSCDVESNKGHAEFRAASMQPPRLGSSGLCGRCILVSLCCFCLLLFVVLVVLISNSPAIRVLLTMFEAPPPPPPRPAAAILSRFAQLKRAKSPLRGVDLQSVQATFPHWKWVESVESVESDARAATSDLALAVAALVQRMDLPQEGGGMPRRAERALPALPVLSNPPSASDAEL